MHIIWCPICNFNGCIHCYSIIRYLNIIHQKYANCGSYRLNLKFLTSDSDSPWKMRPDTNSNDLIWWGHIFPKCGWNTNLFMAGAIDGISNFWLQIWNLLKIWHLVVYKPSHLVGGQILQECLDFLVFCLLWFSLTWYSNSDTGSGFPWKFRIWWYKNHPIWWGSHLSNLHWYFAFYGLACADIQILTPDLDSPRNFAYGGKETVLFGLLTFFGLVHCNVHTC